MRSGSDRRSNWPPVIFRNACTGSGKARLNNPQLERVRWAGAGLAQSGEICCLQLLLRSPSPRALTFPAARADLRRQRTSVPLPLLTPLINAEGAGSPAMRSRRVSPLPPPPAAAARCLGSLVLSSARNPVPALQQCAS